MSSVFLVTSGLDRASLRRHNRDMQMTGEFTVLEVMPWRWRSAATTTTNPASPRTIFIPNLAVPSSAPLAWWHDVAVVGDIVLIYSFTSISV